VFFVMLELAAEEWTKEAGTYGRITTNDKLTSSDKSY
jgi:hypothetical protein